jgi:DNA modification methylase
MATQATQLRGLPNMIGSLTTAEADHLIPKVSRDPARLAEIAAEVRSRPTSHQLILGDARQLPEHDIEPGSVHLAVTSPPYWTLKKYRHSKGQLGEIEDYQRFLEELDKVWKGCFRALVPGGRLVVVVGDVCLSRRQHGRHQVIPLHADITNHARAVGFDNLTPIFWYKIANAHYEAEGNGAGFLGKPFEPNAVVKNDVEFILMLRKPGGYRSPSPHKRLLSVISAEDHKKWFRQVWENVPGESTRAHPAPFPVEVAERLIRMFSFYGDTVLDPFAGTGTTAIAASRNGRDSVSVEIDSEYLALAERRLKRELTSLDVRHKLKAPKRPTTAT